MSETFSVKEILVSELQSRILVEVYLAHGPVDIYRLWSEMFERQKSINEGMLLFTRAIVQLEDEGYLQKAAEMSSTLSPKGEMYLIGAVLSGELPEGCWEKLSSTQNILDVAKGGKNDGRFCIGVLRCSAEVEEESQANEGSSGRGLSPATPEICTDHTEAIGQVNSCLRVRQLRENRQIDVASQASGNAPLTDGFQVGDEGVSGFTGRGNTSNTVPNTLPPQERGISDSQFQGTTIDELLALVASKLPDISLSRQHELEEIEAEREGGDTAASGYQEPGSHPSFA